MNISYSLNPYPIFREKYSPCKKEKCKDLEATTCWSTLETCFDRSAQKILAIQLYRIGWPRISCFGRTQQTVLSILDLETGFILQVIFVSCFFSWTLLIFASECSWPYSYISLFIYVDEGIFVFIYVNEGLFVSYW